MEHLPVSLLVLRSSRSAAEQRQTPTQIFAIPGLLSILATNHLNGEVQGLNQLQAAVREGVRTGQLHPQRLHPVLGDAGHGLPGRPGHAVRAVGRSGCSAERSWSGPSGSCFIAPWVVIAPFLMNTAGWMLTESGRQPWIVQGLMKTSKAASPIGHGHRHLDQPGRLRAPLPRPRGGRRLPDDPLRAEAPGPDAEEDSDRRRGRRRPAIRIDPTEHEDDRVPALIY